MLSALLILAAACVPNTGVAKVDPLAASELIGQPLIEPRFGAACESAGMAFLGGVDSANGEATDSIRRKAAVAIHELDLPICESSVDLIQQDWWTDLTVFRVVCCNGFGISHWIVAVAEDSTVTRVVEPGNSSLDAFNRLAHEHAIRISDPMDAEWYGQFVLNVRFLSRPAYLPSKAVADLVLAEQFDYPSMLVDSFRQITRPVVDIERRDGGFRGVSFLWWWWAGIVDQVVIQIRPDGRVELQVTRIGEQRAS